LQTAQRRMNETSRAAMRRSARPRRRFSLHHGYIADIPDLDACSAFGATAEEALAEVEKAKAAWLGAARESGKPIPEPRYRPAIYAR